MLRSLRASMHHLREAPHGRRFRTHFDHHGTPALHRRFVLSVIGGVIAAIGVAMLVLPGPGVVVILLGLAFLGRAFRVFAALLDWLERHLGRLWRWISSKGPMGRVITILFLVSGAVAAGAFGVLLGRRLNLV